MVTLVCCLSVVMVLSACTGTAGNDEKAEMTNSEYMSQVNRVMEDLSTKLETFNTAVAGNDLVGMKTQADRAFKAIDDLEAIEVPEALKDVQKNYVDGCRDLQTALSDYISLHSDITTATEAEPFDYTTYNDRLEKIQKTYEAGIEKLKEADKKATEIE